MKVYLSVALFSNIQLLMTLYFPEAITSAAETLVSTKRIEVYLLIYFKIDHLHCKLWYSEILDA